MSNVAVVPSYKFSSSNYEAAIKEGMRHAKVHGLEEIKILADSAKAEVVDPQVASWVGDPRRQNSGIIFTPVVTQWSAGRNTAIATRNDALLDNAAAVLVLGPVSTQSAARFLDRAFGEPGITVVQIGSDLKAEVVGAESVSVLDEKYRPVPKAKPMAQAASSWDEFTSAPKKEGRAKK